MKAKKLLILIFCIGFLYSCTNDKKPKKIEFLFAPAFLNLTKFTVDVENKSIEVYTWQTKYIEHEKVKDSLMEDITKDTLIVHYKKTFKISNQNLQDFLKELESSHFDKTIQHGEDCLDGVGFKIDKIDVKNDTISLTTRNPKRNNKYKTDFQILDAFFKLSYATITDYKGICTLENIQDYFNYGLPIRQINKNPLEYRVWGSISGCREDNPSLISFFEKLPKDKPVILDLRNGDFSLCLFEVLADYTKKRKLFFYTNNKASEYKKESEKLKDEMEILKKAKKDFTDIEEQYKSKRWDYKYALDENKLLNRNVKLYFSKEELLKNMQ